MASDLIDQGQPAAAQRILRDVHREIQAAVVSDDLRFRVLTNLGACASQLEEAKRFLFGACQLQPRNAIVIKNAAWISLFCGEHDRALAFAEDARRLDPTDGQAAAVYIRALHAKDGRGALEPLLQEELWLLRDPEARRALGQGSFDDGDYTAARAHFEAILEVTPADTHALVQSATSIVAHSQKELQRDPPPDVPKPFADELREAEERLSRALGHLSGHELAGPRLAALLSRSAARAIRGDTEAALRDCDAVLVGDPGNETALRNKGLLQIRMRRYEDAAAVLSHVKSSEQRPLITVPLAHAYLMCGRAREAADELLPLWEAGLEGHAAAVVADLLTRAYVKLGLAAEADDIVQGLLRGRSDDPEALSVAAEHCRRKGDPGAARGMLERALSL
ncbi:MAG: hypothetical protein ACRDI2_14995, partial [Chloroflexota bacterium]